MNITYRQMQKEDIAKVTPLFIEYWNGTGDEWTPELVYSRVWQVLGSPDSYCMIAEDGENVIGFAMGRFETFYDLTAYNLVEIIVASEYQKSGIGTKMMAELEEEVKEMGAAMVQLISVNDEMHEHFYGKLGYGDATNLKLKSKFLVKME
ncbi:MAG: GNAT family N-acetyltransferase [Clostridia bacterium]|nr:GNAT family N-acetyltransferase [Clostridia bacterium]